MKQQTFYKVFLGILVFKVFCLLFFSSNYQNQLFAPFVEHWLANFDNPWQHFYLMQADKFPYPPLMLYFLAIFYLPYYLLFQDSVILQNLFFKLPILLSDLLITYTLIKMFPKKLKEVIIFYFASPIILYASYMNSQLDLVGVALLILALYLLKINKIVLAAMVFGLALSAKFHLILVLPLILIYVYKNYRKRNVLHFLLIPTGVYLLLALPYLFSQGYFYMVFQNPKQIMMFDSFFPIGDLKVYIPVFVSLVVFFRFAEYRKINHDLFYAFISVLFSAFVLIIFPVYSWYVWMAPFLSIFFIQQYPKRPNILPLYIVFSISYLFFFLFFYIPEYQDLIFLKSPLSFKIYNNELKNIAFTAFEVLLCAIIYILYKFGIKSNSVYKKSHNLIIGIGGDSAAGKNTLAGDIKLLVGEKLLELEGDADHKWERHNENWHKFTHLNPKANYLHKQAGDLLALKHGKSISRNNYDHNQGYFQKRTQILPKEFILLTGLHPFYLPITRKIIDLKIYLDTDEKLRHHWKVKRDMLERSYTKEKVLEQIEARIIDAKKYIHPQRGYADLIIAYSTNDNFVVGDANYQPNLKLKITLDSSIQLEGLLKRLIEKNINIEWDYADDLNSQHIILTVPPQRESIIDIAKEIIPNIEEIILNDSGWLDGYRGFTQFILILILSEKMREMSELNDN